MSETIPIKYTPRGTPVLDTKNMQTRRINGVMCFVSMEHRLITTGFKTQEDLLRNADVLLAYAVNVDMMRDRFAKWEQEARKFFTGDAQP